jgi:hypothetical protein
MSNDERNLKYLTASIVAGAVSHAGLPGEGNEEALVDRCLRLALLVENAVIEWADTYVHKTKEN